MVDDDLYNYLNQWKWFAHKTKGNKRIYVGRTCRITGKPKTIKMHRIIMNTPNHMIVDHKDHNTLNNQRSNLRNCNKSENGANRMSIGSSKYLGVSFNKHAKKWQAYIRKNNKPVYIGKFFDERQAALAYNIKALELHGEYANLNVID